MIVPNYIQSENKKQDRVPCAGIPVFIDNKTHLIGQNNASIAGIQCTYALCLDNHDLSDVQIFFNQIFYKFCSLRAVAVCNCQNPPGQISSFFYNGFYHPGQCFFYSSGLCQLLDHSISRSFHHRLNIQRAGQSRRQTGKSPVLAKDFQGFQKK